VGIPVEEDLNKALAECARLREENARLMELLNLPVKDVRFREKSGFDAKEVYLFPNKESDCLSPVTIGHIITSTGRKAGLTGEKISCHTFRHYFAKNYIVNGGDVFSLQKIWGHTSLAMVRHYTNLDNADVINAHRKVSPLTRIGKNNTKIASEKNSRRLFLFQRI